MSVSHNKQLYLPYTTCTNKMTARNTDKEGKTREGRQPSGVFIERWSSNRVIKANMQGGSDFHVFQHHAYLLSLTRFPIFNICNVILRNEMALSCNINMNRYYMTKPFHTLFLGLVETEICPGKSVDRPR